MKYPTSAQRAKGIHFQKASFIKVTVRLNDQNSNSITYLLPRIYAIQDALYRQKKAPFAARQREHSLKLSCFHLLF